MSKKDLQIPSEAYTLAEQRFSALLEIVREHPLVRKTPKLFEKIETELQAYRSRVMACLLLGQINLEQFPPLDEALSTPLSDLSFATFGPKLVPQKPPSSGEVIDTRIRSALSYSLLRDLGDLVTVKRTQEGRLLDTIRIGLLKNIGREHEARIRLLLERKFDFQRPLTEDEVRTLSAWKYERTLAKLDEATRKLQDIPQGSSRDFDHDKLLRILSAEVGELDNLRLSSAQAAAVLSRFSSFIKQKSSC